MYRFLRRNLAIPFYAGEVALDTSLRKIFAAIQQHDMDDVLVDIFKQALQEGAVDYSKEFDDNQRLSVKQWTRKTSILISASNVFRCHNVANGSVACSLKYYMM